MAVYIGIDHSAGLLAHWAAGAAGPRTVSSLLLVLPALLAKRATKMNILGGQSPQTSLLGVCQQYHH